MQLHILALEMCKYQQPQGWHVNYKSYYHNTYSLLGDIR